MEMENEDSPAFRTLNLAEISARRSQSALRSQDQAARATRRLILRSLSLSLAIWLFLGILPLIVWPLVSSLTIDRLGVFGDSFGMVNSLFTGLAFAAVISALYLQRRDWLAAIQRHEGGRREDTADRLFMVEVEAQGNVAIARAILAAVGPKNHDGNAAQACDAAIADLEASIHKIGQLRLANAIGRSLLERDEVALRAFGAAGTEGG
jgi:hypothetical protein